jgi:hypothetical protein
MFATSKLQEQRREYRLDRRKDLEHLATWPSHGVRRALRGNNSLGHQSRQLASLDPASACNSKRW